MSRRESKRHKKSFGGIFLFLLFLVILGLGGFLGYKVWERNQEENGDGNSKNLTNVEATAIPEPEKKVQIFSGDDRPIAVMLDNNVDAWPHASINDAYAVYEIIVEGNETRLMALFKGKELDEVGPVRSARHYFLDYALENDAIYTHFGWSPQAEAVWHRRPSGRA